MVDFINDDHREMHEVLLQKGFTFEQNAKWHISGIRWDFVYQKRLYDSSLFIVFDKRDEVVYAKVYSGQVCTGEVPHFEPLNGKTFKDVTVYYTLGKSPVDSNQKTPSAITRDNIKDTLQYNSR